MKQGRAKILCIGLIVTILCTLPIEANIGKNNANAKNTSQSKISAKSLNAQNSATVTMNNSNRIFQTNISKEGFCLIETQNNTSTVTIKAVGKNLYNGSYDKGNIKLDTKEKLSNANSRLYRTTKWMPVFQGQTLTISGTGVNQNIWQFKNSAGTVYSIQKGSTVQVPYQMEYARVYYSNNTSGNVQIEYGSNATKYESYKENTLTIAASKDTKVHEKLDSILCYEGITTFYLSGTKTGSVKITYPKRVTTNDNGTYGVRWSLTELTEKCERLDAAVGLTANSVEGDLSVANDFDYVYPWSEMKLCNIDSNEKITYIDQKGFSYTGSNGNVFVEIPKYYIKRYQDGNYEYLYISKTQKEGFEVEPAFIEGSQVLDKIYIAAYDGYVTKDNKLVSWSGTYPTTNLSLKTYREYARNNGSLRYGVLDMRCVVALQHLYLVEFANKNSSKTVGMGLQKMQFPFTKSAVKTELKANRIILKKNTAKCFKVGQSCEISEKGDYRMEHRKITSIVDYDDQYSAIYFTGDPYDVKESTTYIYNTPLASGMCDSMTSPNGFAYDLINGNGFTSVRYRFIENPWGNIWNCIDGVLVSNRVPAICYDMTKYVSSGSSDYIPLGYSLPYQQEHGYGEEYVKITIKNLGYDSKYPAIGLPVEIGNGANKDNSFADCWYCGNGEKTEVRWKGAWDLGIGVTDRAGLFILRAWFSVDKPYYHDGARLMYKPIKLAQNN